MSERDYCIGFSVFPGIGPIKFKRLLVQFGNAKDVWEASKLDLTKVVGKKLAAKFDKFRNKFSISDYAKKLKDSGVSFLILTDKEYPKLLSQIKNPPFVLYVKGDVTTLYSFREGAPSGTPESRSSVIPELIDPRLDRGLDSRFRGNDKFSSRPASSELQRGEQARTIIPTIAVVGTRRITQYGREVTKILTEELVVNGFTIVSGLAIGVDSVSHKTAIDNGGKTIAVLGCGVDCCYPLANQAIYNSIVSGNGCVVSEYPLSQAPTRGSFPARNRIIAGLALGVLVTEGAEDSGSLITASYTVKFGRPVFAVPGPITSSLSKGPYKLIEKGAKLVTSASDIFKELKTQNLKVKATTQKSKLENATKEEQAILDLLENEPLHFDEIAKRSKMTSSEIGSILSIMEIKGMVRSLEAGVFLISS